jgi:hypothetical protein
VGFDRWFEQQYMLSGLANGDGSYAINRLYTATEEGALEALRIAQEHFPGAKLENHYFGMEGGPWRASGPERHIVLPNGVRLNAGMLLNSYYNGGRGVTAGSDLNLLAEVSEAEAAAGTSA